MALASMSAAFAQEASAPQPHGQPQSAPLRDAEFGVTTRSLGLQRRVQMYQWQASGRGYAATWSERAIDSTGFAAGHENPGAFPLRTRYWIAPRIQLDGRPLHEDVLKHIGQWRDFRPGFSALPGNLAATFQPEGDGLGSAENPLQPQIGDLRVTWRELHLPPLAGQVVLEDGVWVLAPDAAARASTPDAPLAQAPSHRACSTRVLAFMALVAAGLAFAWLVVARRRKARRR